MGGGENRGELLLRRVLAGSGAEPGPGWHVAGPTDEPDVDLDGAGPLRHAVRLPARAGMPVDWPLWVPEHVRAAFTRAGVLRPWSHQAHAAELAHTGRDVVVATGTASGKSLAYQLPVLAAFDADPRATALYLAQILKPFPVKVTRIAHGVPLGGDLDYLDERTLSYALSGRREV